MKSKWRYLLKITIKQIFFNRLRTILTLSGISLAIVILSTSFITLDSYYSAQHDIYDNYSQHSVFQVRGIFDQSSLNEISEEFTVLNEFAFIYSTNLYENDQQNEEILSFIQSKGKLDNSISPYFSEEKKITDIKLISGRDFIETDINKVLVHTYYAESICSNIECSSESIEVDIYDFVETNGIRTREVVETVTLEIIGVYDAESIPSQSIVYLSNNQTLSQVLASHGEEMIQFYYLILLDQELRNPIDFLNFKELKLDYSVDVIYYEELIRELEFELEQTTQTIRLIAILIAVFAGINVLNILVFSIKERITEIGLKVALGATKYHIFKQFVLESFVYLIFSTVIGLVLGVIISFIITLVSRQFGLNLVYTIQWKSILNSILIPSIATLFATIGVTLYALKIKITDALRFD